MMLAFRRWLRNDDGSAAIAYVALLLPLIALVFNSLQIALAYHFALAAQKAVELGARIAAMCDAVHTELPDLNQRATGARAGDACAEGGCTDPVGPWTCSGAMLLSGANCDAANFVEIRNEVARLAYLLDDHCLSIPSRNGLLGFAEGPFVPIVEISIQERPFILQFFSSLALGGDDDAVEVSPPAVAATAIAEDLSSKN